MSLSKTMVVSDIWKEGYERLAAEMASFLPDDTGTRVLELGAGRGQLTIPLLSRFKGRIVAVDRSGEGLERLSKTLAALGLQRRVEPMLCDARDLRLEDESVDCVYSNFFFGWLDRPSAVDVLNELHRVLKRGGAMAHSDFHPVAENRAQQIVIEQGRRENNFNPSPKWWATEELTQIAEDAGFSHIEVFNFNWDTRFGYDEARRQLERWGSKDAFIRSVDDDLRRYGIELPKSFILLARKV